VARRHALARKVHDKIRRRTTNVTWLAHSAGVDQVVSIVADRDLFCRQRPDDVIPKLENAELMRMTEGADVRSRRVCDERLKGQAPPFLAIEADAFAPALGVQRTVHRHEAIVDARLER
jgi:hypothetical protein